MVVNVIIDRVVGSRRGYRDDDFYVPVLFHADDGLLLARSCGEAEDMIGLVVEVAGKCGLNINKGKSNVLVYNRRGRGHPKRVGGIEVASSVRYLGTDLGNSRQCFGSYKKGKLVLTESMANLAFSVVYRSCDRLLIGKTYWKSVVQPIVLSASSVVVWSRQEKAKLQVVENRVWRCTNKYTGGSVAGGDRGVDSGGEG